MTKGKLYVVATPIGNLEDITFRAVDVLRKVNLIACEDTRKSRVLLQRWNISSPLVSLHRFSEVRRTKAIIERLERGDHVALISDAGTPAISDPGAKLIKVATEAGFVVTPIPGASSVTTALSVSGMDCSSFTYLGFVPRKTDQKRIFFEDLRTETRTTIFFETARRIEAALTTAAEILPSRRMVMSRELTKLHEDIISGTADVLLKALQSKGALRGEMTVAVEGAQRGEDSEDPDAAVKHLMSEGFSGKRLAEEAQRRFGINKTAAYRRYLDLKKSDT